MKQLSGLMGSGLLGSGMECASMALHGSGLCNLFALLRVCLVLRLPLLGFVCCLLLLTDFVRELLCFLSISILVFILFHFI